jgi:hypothetical protein
MENLLNPEHLVAAVVLTTVLIAVTASWRLALLALLAQYAAWGGLLARMVAPPAGGARLLVGALVCLLLYVTLRQVNPAPAPRAGPRLRASLVGLRLSALALAGLGVFGTPAHQMAAHLPAPVAGAALWLIAAGLLIALLRPVRLWMGLGLLSAVSGVEIAYPLGERSLLAASLGLAAPLFVALLVAVLLVARRTGG